MNRPLTIPVLLAAALSAAGCGGEAHQGAAANNLTLAADSVSAEPPAIAPPAPVSPPLGPTTDLPPNELGEILVLEYHRLGENEGEFIRKAENFRNDLQTLYEKGYRPVTMRQVLEGDINIPKGTTPVVFTIDDSSLGQFYFLEDGSIDPNTMMGMWDAFREKNPGWSNGAVWCVLPAADHPSNFFGEKPSRQIPREQREATIRKKVDHLVQNGHEICNHTLYHARLDRAKSDAQVQEWIGRGEDSIKVYLPADYDIVTLALPLGQWPKNRSLAWRGSWNGNTYENVAILEVSGGPNASPFDTRFDPHSVNRFIVAPNHLERQITAYERDPSKRFVSDGDPSVVSVPERLADRLNHERLNGREARILPGPSAPTDSL